MITLGVRHLRTSIKFYHEGLGLKCKGPKRNAIAFFDLNGT